jgi:hypothetical protein
MDVVMIPNERGRPSSAESRPTTYLFSRASFLHLAFIDSPTQIQQAYPKKEEKEDGINT